MSTSLALAERNVPRYTSYPTAPHFSAAIGPELYGEWLSQLPRDASLSLYIHVPFCTEMCFYCGCNTRAVRKREPVDAYANRLLEEIELLEGLAGRKLTHLHWGGGTPSILGPEWLETVAAKLASRFDLSALKEHAIARGRSYFAAAMSSVSPVRRLNVATSKRSSAFASVVTTSRAPSRRTRSSRLSPRFRRSMNVPGSHRTA